MTRNERVLVVGQALPSRRVRSRQRRRSPIGRIGSSSLFALLLWASPSSTERFELETKQLQGLGRVSVARACDDAARAGAGGLSRRARDDLRVRRTGARRLAVVARQRVELRLLPARRWCRVRAGRRAVAARRRAPATYFLLVFAALHGHERAELPPDRRRLHSLRRLVGPREPARDLRAGAAGRVRHRTADGRRRLRLPEAQPRGDRADRGDRPGVPVPAPDRAELDQSARSNSRGARASSPRCRSGCSAPCCRRCRCATR